MLFFFPASNALLLKLYLSLFCLFTHSIKIKSVFNFRESSGEAGKALMRKRFAVFQKTTSACFICALLKNASLISMEEMQRASSS